MRTLLMEDEEKLVVWLVCALAQNDFTIERAAGGIIAEAFLGSGELDTVVLDLHLSHKDGFAMLADICARDDCAPVLILTVQGALDEHVRGLSAGADDSLIRPPVLPKLEARSMAPIHHSRGQAFLRLHYRPPEFGTGRKAFLLSGKPPALTSHRHTVPSVLLHRTGQSVSKAYLFDKVLNLDSNSSPDVVEMIVYRLHKELVGTSVQIVTVRGLGYLLEADDGEVPAVGNNSVWYSSPPDFSCRVA